MTEGFDYGERQEDGQYERHPTVDEGDFQEPIRRKYQHECGATTVMAEHLAESFARKPDYYGKAFCARCEGYFPVEEFKWPDGKQVGVSHDTE